MNAFFKTPPFVSDKLRNFAKGKDCQMRSEWCNGMDAVAVTPTNTRWSFTNCILPSTEHNAWYFRSLRRYAQTD